MTTKTIGVWAESEKDAILKVGTTGYAIQSVTRIHDDFYHVRLIQA